ncbi:heme-binding protein [Halomonas saccharevitans]|uniref:Glc operon protein GlcG n=1 Tax=Halomonas saccharevitans TaxID=416872 RepID=A0A1I6XU99_9GAMM|nr:heme-binding protein [Halomonas saccharevitans]MDT8879559.1 heme-binding protein [Halomonas saccharevitans]SFT41656.1 glc operon protein GlcG [Halomonas saccharevitans]
MQTKAILGLAEVNAILDAAQQAAEANGWQVTVAVTDDSGELLGLRRLDGAAPMTAMISAQKARTAALSHKETQVFERMINEGRTAFLSAPLEGLLEGGVPVVVDGRVIGAVGISGVKSDQDAQVAKAAVAAIG